MATAEIDIPEFEVNGYKIYRGAYTYHKGTVMFAEETFEVFRDRKDHSLHFKSEINSRVSTGELLNVKLDYFVNKDFVPQKVLINRSLGQENVAEYFVYDKKKDTIFYEFIENVGTTYRELKTPVKFHISVPNSACSTLFLKSKKFDSSGINYFSIWNSYNQWRFEETPTLRSVIVKKMSSTHENIMIDGHNVQAIHYRLGDSETSPLEVEDNNKFLNIHLSKFGAIPYGIRSDAEGVKVQIKYFNNLDDHT
jgi:hypothetical protein